jgi:hypothetical protein
MFSPKTHLHVHGFQTSVFVLGRPDQVLACLAAAVRLAAAVLLPAAALSSGLRLAAPVARRATLTVAVVPPRPAGLEAVSRLLATFSAFVGRVDSGSNRLLRLILLRVLVWDACGNFLKKFPNFSYFRSQNCKLVMEKEDLPLAWHQAL